MFLLKITFLLKILSVLRSAAEIAAMHADLTIHGYVSAQNR